VKALHSKVDKGVPASSQHCLKWLYCPAAIVFSLGGRCNWWGNSDCWPILMQKPKQKASEPPNIGFWPTWTVASHGKWQCYTLSIKQPRPNLCQLIMAIPDPEGPHWQLFHSVNKMYLKQWFFVKPNNLQSTRNKPTRIPTRWGSTSGHQQNSPPSYMTRMTRPVSADGNGQN